MQTSKEERAQWAELCEQNKPVDWTSNSLGFTLITALPRLLADFEELERKVREYIAAMDNHDFETRLWRLRIAEAALRAAVEGEK